MQINPIAYIHTDFKEKFGIPRQSGRVPELLGRIVFEADYRVEQAFAGIEDFSHLWLIFDFSKSHREKWSPTVRPPRLGGNKRVGVFASRSPFRPNSLGLSAVKLERVEKTEKYGITLVVSGVDLLDNTPIYDIKPYIPYADCIGDAKGSYADDHKCDSLNVDFKQELLQVLPEGKRQAVIKCLADDPRPAYKENDGKIYSMSFAGFDIHFTVENNTAVVQSVEKL